LTGGIDLGNHKGDANAASTGRRAGAERRLRSFPAGSGRRAAAPSVIAAVESIEDRVVVETSCPTGYA
jgi:hypothetical protein